MKCGGVLLVFLLCIETIHSKDTDSGTCLAPKPCSCVDDEIIANSKIDCSGKNITDEHLKQMKFPTNFEYLDLTKNKLTRFPVELNFTQTSFQTLDLGYNNISYIGHSSTLAQSFVRDIYLNNNNLNGTLCLSNLTAFENLSNLSLSHNRLLNIDSNAFRKMLNLSSLNIKGNKLTKLTAYTFTNNILLEMLDLQANPLVCDCEMCIIRSFVDGCRQECTWQDEKACVPCPKEFKSLYQQHNKSVCSGNVKTCYLENGELNYFKKQRNLSNSYAAVKANFTCHCKDGYEGKYCERYSYCFPNPCQNNGTCNPASDINLLNYLNPYTCSCATGYSGARCEIKDPCRLPNNTCHHNGICYRINATEYECRCEYPWVGEQCEELHVCQKDNPCQNNATCTHILKNGYSSNEYQCDCEVEFVGKNCQQNNTCLTNNPCHPNGTERCTMVQIPGNQSYEVDCICKAGFNGSTCTDNISEGDNERKKNDKIIITSDGKKNWNFQIILGISISITVCVILVALYYWLHKKFYKQKHNVENNYLLQEMAKGNSVFVLYLHGCEIYHKFLRNFTLILHSHGVKVHIAMSEQTKIDAEGGIKLFTERHILNSDYTLVMLTKTRQIPHLHMDYEYGMHLMRNQINNQDDCTKYVPIYLDGKREGQQLMPPFLAGCRNYSLPTDIEDLLLMFLGEVELTRVDRIRISNMEKLSQEMASDHHNRCIRTYCGRGRIEPSVSKLSSSCMSLSTVKDDFYDGGQRLMPIHESVDEETRINNFLQSLPSYEIMKTKSRSMPDFQKSMDELTA